MHVAQVVAVIIGLLYDIDVLQEVTETVETDLTPDSEVSIHFSFSKPSTF